MIVDTNRFKKMKKIMDHNLKNSGMDQGISQKS